MNAKSGLALDKDNEKVKFYINERTVEFTYEEFDELNTLYGEMVSTNYFGNPICVYRDNENKLHRLCTE